MESWGAEAGGNDLRERAMAQLELSSGGWADILAGMFPTQNLRVKEMVRLSPPRALKAELPMTEAANATVLRGRQSIKDMLEQKDPRLLVVVGPCSIHDATGAMEYAGKLNALRKEFADQMEIVMRVYFEKPRTTVGWKGLINDPHLDNTHDIEAGLKKARRLLLDITGMGLPAATEFLDPIIPQYISDLISWAAIGARTTESQTHREMASGLSMPVGFKNATDGGLQIAIDAMGAAMRPHSFLGIDQDGVTSIIRATGNPAGHIVLRGGRHLRRHIRQHIHKLRRPRTKSQQIVNYHHVPIATGPRAAPQHRHIHLAGYRCGNLVRHRLQQNHRRPGPGQ